MAIDCVSRVRLSTIGCRGVHHGFWAPGFLEESESESKAWEYFSLSGEAGMSLVGAWTCTLQGCP
jgi:hypothetical protein